MDVIETVSRGSDEEGAPLREVCRDCREGIPVRVYASVSMLVRSVNAPGIKMRHMKNRKRERLQALEQTQPINWASGILVSRKWESSTWSESARVVVHVPG